MAASFAGTVVDGIEDIEWDKEKGFLGFTLESRSHMYDYGSDIQGKFRYNFLEFEHNPKFKTVPYRHSNSKYINVLHVIGKDVGHP